MPEYKILLEFSRPEYVKELNASRVQEQGLLNVWLQVKKEHSLVDIELSGYGQLGEAIGPLLNSERVIISRELNSGKEFGTIKIECWVDDRCSEFICDAALSI